MGYMSYIRELGKYMNSQDNISYILSDKYKAVRYKSNVYLFSNEELQRFFKQIDIYSKTASTIRLSTVLPALFKFLYYFGTRCKEARVLETRNVHLDLGYIDIIASKTHCDRRIFMNDEAIEFFRRYHCIMNHITPNRKYFFSDIADRYYPTGSISLYFNKIWDQAGLRKDAEVVMTDTQGKVLISHKIMAGVNEVNLDLSNIAAGTYIIRIDGIKGTAVRKLIKQ